MLELNLLVSISFFFFYINECRALLLKSIYPSAKKLNVIFCSLLQSEQHRLELLQN
jgi:hypothetical protein